METYGVNLAPELENLFFLLGEVELSGSYKP